MPVCSLLLIAVFSYMTPDLYGKNGYGIAKQHIEFNSGSKNISINCFENSNKDGASKLQVPSNRKLNLNNKLIETVNKPIKITRPQKRETSPREGEEQTRMIKVFFYVGISLFVLLTSSFIVLLFHIKQKGVREKNLFIQQKNYFNTALEAQDTDRKLIANKLRDSVGQMLSLIKLNISELNDSVCNKTGEQKEALERSLKIIDDACTEVRSISHNLMPGSLISLGLIPATRDLIRTINETTNIKARLHTALNGERFEEKFEITFFRILQELLGNAIEHSKASNINVEYSSEGSSLKLTIKDNGIAFNSGNIGKNSGIAWKNISSRLSLINGEMSARTESGWGSVVTISANTK